MRTLERPWLWVKGQLWWFGWPRFFRFAEFSTFIAVIVTFVGWLLEADDRVIERRYRAWELINSAAGLPGDGGRSDALENLVKDGRSLAGAFLEKAHLPEINLRSANLSDARMKKARLHGADLGGAVLNGADLRDADLSSSMSCPETGYRWSEHDVAPGVCDKPIERRTNLKGASLWGAKLQGADLDRADLTCANLHWADLSGTKNLKQSQLNVALGGKNTTLTMVPEYGPPLELPCHWQVPVGGCLEVQEPECAVRTTR